MISFLAALALGISNLAIAGSKPKAMSLEIAQAIKSPPKYQGKLVRIKGFANIVFEGTAIYSGSDEIDSKRGLWLEMSREMFQQEMEKQKGTQGVLRKVEVEGVFDPTNKGHMGMWPAAVTVSKLKHLK